MEEVLRRHPQAPARVFVIWEPILATDWAAPTTIVLHRLSDHRVRQFWDKNHVIAQRLARDARPPQPVPHCCEENGNLWDLAAVYPRGVTWTSVAPTAQVFDGPVFAIASDIEAAIRAAR